MKKNNDGLKKHNKTSEKSLPPIRRSKNDTSTEAVNSNKTGHIKSLEYDKWDKYDAGKFIKTNQMSIHKP